MTFVKRSVFISYHHANDQWYCDRFRNIFCNDFSSIFNDKSLNRARNSNDATYIDRVVREQYIRGSSVTIVLCGQDTDLRKFVDWEIHDTLNEDHGLLAVILPTCGIEQIQYSVHSNSSRPRVPGRLRDNIDSGFAHSIYWIEDHYIMRTAVEQAIRQKRISLKRNGRSLMRINGFRRY